MGWKLQNKEDDKRFPYSTANEIYFLKIPVILRALVSGVGDNNHFNQLQYKGME